MKVIDLNKGIKKVLKEEWGCMNELQDRYDLINNKGFISDEKKMKRHPKIISEIYCFFVNLVKRSSDTKIF